MIEHEIFQIAVVKSGSRDTSSTPKEWVETNSVIGHCAVVALIVQDIYGGELLRASLEETEFAYGKSHYWNLLPDGTEVDFTEMQFEGKKPLLVGEIRTRDYVLSNEQTRQRYEAFKGRLIESLGRIDS